MTRILPIQSTVIRNFESPDFGDPLKMSTKNLEMADMVRSMPRSQVALVASQFSCFSSIEYPSADFTLEEGFRKGREQSRQGVYFGHLRVETENHPGITNFVAVKPYDNRPASIDFGIRRERALINDWATNDYLNRLSTGTAYTVRGVWRNHDSYVVPQLVTDLNERSTSMDNALVRAPEDTSSFGKRLGHMLGSANFGLGFLHGARITHNDAFPQNFATDGSRIILNDTTTLRPFGRDETQTLKATKSDVDTLLRGVLHVDTDELVRELAKGLLASNKFCVDIYKSYASGVKLSVDRLGVAPTPFVLGEADFVKITQRVVQQYTSNGPFGQIPKY